MQSLTYVIGKDKRNLVDDIQNFKIDFDDSNSNWVQARQYEDGMRQVFVTMKNKDGSPFDLTGCNYWFEGILPDGVHKILDANHGVAIDPVNGQFRFDMPKQAFAVAGSYVQAFFRIMKDGASITTLEFDLQVLADKVISGLVPRDYITPFEDLYDQLNNMGIDTKAMLQTIQKQISDLEAEIKQDKLFTQADADNFKQEINNQLSAAKQELDNKIDRILQYHSISISVSPNMQLTDNDISHLQKLGAEATLISMVNINNATDSNPQLDDDARIKDAISRLKTAGIKIDMIKPHLGINWSDGFYRGDYNPASYSDFFNNWKNILLHYAEICDQNGIPILCIGCEQVNNFDDSHANNWEDIIANIRTNYPKLLLTVAFNRLELVPSYEWPAKLDYIGTNVYPALSPNFDENNLLILDDLKANFYYDMQGIPWGARISAINDAYHLPIFVTECGCMPEKDGLVQSLSQYASQTPYDYHVSALFMETAFSGWMKDIPSIVGFAWWHVRDPFNFYDGATESEAETVYKKYVGGGLI
ncbi:BppU family phage baseplate upper protein [Lactiplantibacillus plantarum]|uniref:BppU family phage baseplate upper protein n=1 Tax=Lactiplantibacillus plantarum TaxID=1590 RepID=UPI000FECCB6B|nr:BppU family phage baseplate upper protein [Lactiplantibacillus plantarum]QAR36931.1 DUF2479 domain-containing protein [Lactiplantibacillus plantarum]RWZ07105.1 DUF2479 domain-containing protein [Lactiplantibacillus plantarum]RWZ34944.1 DUF2479 domain-containing protein [Lactiplantibacillus plantarum]